MFEWNWLYIGAIFQITALIVGTIFAIHKYFKRLTVAEVLETEGMLRVEDRLERIEKQFGPNGGGLRQAVNELTAKITRMEERQINIGGEVASLSGKFEQHIAENNK